MTGSTCRVIDRRDPVRGVARRVIDRRDVVRGAAQHFRAHGSLDMDRLATELAVSRATLYRVVGSRDTLLGDTLWLLGRRLLDTARHPRSRPSADQDASRHARGRPGADQDAARRAYGRSSADRVIVVSRRFVAGCRSAEPLRRFVTGEPHAAARILLTPGGAVHRRAVRAQHEILAEAGLVGADLCALAGLYVTVMESVLFGDWLGGPRVDFATAEPALRALLTASTGRSTLVGVPSRPGENV